MSEGWSLSCRIHAPRPRSLFAGLGRLKGRFELGLLLRIVRGRAPSDGVSIRAEVPALDVGEPAGGADRC